MLADGNATRGRPGLRGADGLEILAACAKPEFLPAFAARSKDDFVRFTEV